MASTNDFPAQFFNLPIQIVSRAMASSTANAGDMSGAAVCLLSNTGATPGTFTPRTAAQMFADSNLYIGLQYWLAVVNTVTTNAITMGTATGVTVNGTTTIAGFTGRLYQVLCGGTIASPTVVLTGLAFSWTVAGA